MSTSSKEEQKQQEQGDQHEDKKIHKPRSGSATASRKPPLHRNNVSAVLWPQLEAMRLMT